MKGRDNKPSAGTKVKMVDAVLEVKYSGTSHAAKPANNILTPTERNQKVSDFISVVVLRQAGRNLLSSGRLKTTSGVSC